MLILGMGCSAPWKGRDRFLIRCSICLQNFSLALSFQPLPSQSLSSSLLLQSQCEDVTVCQSSCAADISLFPVSLHSCSPVGTRPLPLYKVQWQPRYSRGYLQGAEGQVSISTVTARPVSKWTRNVPIIMQKAFKTLEDSSPRKASKTAACLS